MENLNTGWSNIPIIENIQNEVQYLQNWLKSQPYQYQKFILNYLNVPYKVCCTKTNIGITPLNKIYVAYDESLFYTNFTTAMTKYNQRVKPNWKLFIDKIIETFGYGPSDNTNTPLHTFLNANSEFLKFNIEFDNTDIQKLVNLVITEIPDNRRWYHLNFEDTEENNTILNDICDLRIGKQQELLIKMMPFETSLIAYIIYFRMNFLDKFIYILDMLNFDNQLSENPSRNYLFGFMYKSFESENMTPYQISNLIFKMLVDDDFYYNELNKLINFKYENLEQITSMKVTEYKNCYLDVIFNLQKYYTTVGIIKNTETDTAKNTNLIDYYKQKLDIKMLCDGCTDSV